MSAGGITGVALGEITAMAIADYDALTQFEVEARKGRAEALYNLGLAYSTGQGVGVDYVEAHKWFNLAAMKGVIEARKWRAQISAEMSADQIAEAQRQARKWLAA
jgi:TPR repeat protein